MQYNRYLYKNGYDEDDSLRKERRVASKAARELLVGHPKTVRDSFADKIKAAKSSGEISRYLAEVRELI